MTGKVKVSAGSGGWRASLQLCHAPRPLPWQVLVKAGDAVAEGAPLMILEAMKMEVR